MLITAHQHHHAIILESSQALENTEMNRGSTFESARTWIVLNHHHIASQILLFWCHIHNNQFIT